MSRALRRRVSATAAITARTRESSSDAASFGSRAAFPATHSTRPTSLASATAPAAVPVGGYGVPANWSLSSDSSDFTAACAS